MHVAPFGSVMKKNLKTTFELKPLTSSQKCKMWLNWFWPRSLEFQWNIKVSLPWLTPKFLMSWPITVHLHDALASSKRTILIKEFLISVWLKSHIPLKKNTRSASDLATIWTKSTHEEKEFYYKFHKKKWQMPKTAFTRLANQLELELQSKEYSIAEIKQMSVSLKTKL